MRLSLPSYAQLGFMNFAELATWVNLYIDHYDRLASDLAPIHSGSHERAQLKRKSSVLLTNENRSLREEALDGGSRRGQRFDGKSWVKFARRLRWKGRCPIQLPFLFLGTFLVMPERADGTMLRRAKKTCHACLGYFWGHFSTCHPSQNVATHSPFMFWKSFMIHLKSI